MPSLAPIRLWPLLALLALVSAGPAAAWYDMAPIEQQPLLSTEVDSDGDGLSNLVELVQTGTDPFDPDTDGDGWADGPVNARYSLRLISVFRDDWGWACPWGDRDIYVIVDDARWPQAAATSGNEAIDGAWSIRDFHSVFPDTIVDERTAPLQPPSSMWSRIELWDDGLDLGVSDDWEEDDLAADLTLDLLAFTPEQPFQITASDWCSDWELTLMVHRTPFADPDPLDGGTSDHEGDGLTDANEALLATLYGGRGDPLREDLWLEVDTAADVFGWEPATRTMLVSQFARHGVALHIDEGGFGGGSILAHTGYMSLAQWSASYVSNFAPWRRGLFRYAILVGDLWTGDPGLTFQDTFVLDQDGLWVDDSAVGQAGSAMHELGHSLGLTAGRFPTSYIDVTPFTLGSLSYVSSMNPMWRYLVVDFAPGAAPAPADLDEWASIEPNWALAQP